MRLVPRAEGKGRVPAVEIMVATQSIRESIIDADKTRRIPEIIAAGKSQYGMQTFDQSLFDLYEKKLIAYEEALRCSTNPDDFTLKVKGIQSTGEMSLADQEKLVGENIPESDFKIERFTS